MATFKMSRGNAPQPTKVEPNKPFVIPGVEKDSQGNFSVDWQRLGLLRQLDEDELLCLKIYAEHKEDCGSFPRTEMKHSMIRNASLELRPGRPITKKQVDEFLFVDLFPFNPDINFTTAVRRLLSDSRGMILSEESEHALRFLCEEMNSGNESGVRIIPNTGDVDMAVREGLFVPGLVGLLPSSSTLLSSLGGGSWSEICKRVLGAT